MKREESYEAEIRRLKQKEAQTLEQLVEQHKAAKNVLESTKSVPGEIPAASPVQRAQRENFEERYKKLQAVNEDLMQKITILATKDEMIHEKLKAFDDLQRWRSKYKHMEQILNTGFPVLDRLEISVGSF